MRTESSWEHAMTPDGWATPCRLLLMYHSRRAGSLQSQAAGAAVVDVFAGHQIRSSSAAATAGISDLNGAGSGTPACRAAMTAWCSTCPAGAHWSTMNALYWSSRR